MKNLLKKFQANMAAATFAEAGEWEAAKKMAPETELSRELHWLEKIFTAVTFAESGLHDAALEMLKPVRRGRKGFNQVMAEDLGLPGVKLMYGTVSI